MISAFCFDALTLTGAAEPGAAPVALISSVLWQRRFAASPDILGKTIPLDQDVYTIIGLLPAGTHSPPQRRTFGSPAS